MPLHYNTRQQQQQQPAKSRQQPLLDANSNSTGLAGCCLCQLYCWLLTFPYPDVALSTTIERSSRTSHARSSLLTFPSPDACWHTLARATLHLLPVAACHQAAQGRRSCLTCSKQCTGQCTITHLTELEQQGACSAHSQGSGAFVSPAARNGQHWRCTKTFNAVHCGWSMYSWLPAPGACYCCHSHRIWLLRCLGSDRQYARMCDYPALCRLLARTWRSGYCVCKFYKHQACMSQLLTCG
jgi:hypothetical protein